MQVCHQGLKLSDCCWKRRPKVVIAPPNQFKPNDADGMLFFVQELVEMSKMETSASSKIPAPGSSLESQGRAVSMPRLNAELQVTPHFYYTCVPMGN